MNRPLASRGRIFDLFLTFPPVCVAEAVLLELLFNSFRFLTNLQIKNPIKPNIIKIINTV